MDKTFTFKDTELRLTDGFVEIDMAEIPYTEIEAVTYKRAAFGATGELRIKPKIGPQTKVYFKRGINKQVMEIAAHIVKSADIKLSVVKKNGGKLPLLIIPMALIVCAAVFLVFFWDDVRELIQGDDPYAHVYDMDDMDDMDFGDFFDERIFDDRITDDFDRMDIPDDVFVIERDDFLPVPLSPEVFVSRVELALGNMGVDFAVELYSEVSGYLVLGMDDGWGRNHITLDISEGDEVERVMYRRTGGGRLGLYVALSAMVAALEPDLADRAQPFVLSLIERGGVQSFGTRQFTVYEGLDGQGGYFDLTIEPDIPDEIEIDIFADF